MRKNIPLTQEVKDKMSLLLSKGMNKAEIARSLNVSYASVSRYTIKVQADENAIKDRNESIIELYNNGLTQLEIADNLNIDQSTVQRALIGVEKIVRPKKVREKRVAKKKEPISITINHKGNDKEIKELWLSGRNFTQIARQLKIGFDAVRKAVIQMGIEDAERSTPRGDKMKSIDRYSGKVKVQINHKTWAYMDSERWDCEDKFRKFKIKQLGL